jgi:tetratricopeptide (TPR) repeat protein
VPRPFRVFVTLYTSGCCYCILSKTSQGRNDEASEVLPVEPSYLKYDMGLLQHDERIRQDPEDSVEYLNRGIWHHWNESFDKALTDFDTSILINPTIAYAFCARASLRATCPDETFRDGQMALYDARTALELAEEAGQLIGDWRHRLYLQVMAAAHAENDEFEEAIMVQTRALELALTNRSKSEISQRLEQYRLGDPIWDEKGLIRSGYSPERHAASSPAHPVDPTEKWRPTDDDGTPGR